MKYYKPVEWLEIQAANACGLDKVTYEERLAAFPSLSVEKAENVLLFKNTMKAIEDYKNGTPNGTPVMLDACSSGIQILSAVTACRKGCEATGLINTGRRPNAYRDVENKMKSYGIEGEVCYDDIKKCVMTSFYGSKAVPRELLDEAVLPYFYKACKEVLPGAWKACQKLLETWNQKEEVQQWTLPDGHVAYCPVSEKVGAYVHIDEVNMDLPFFYQKVGRADAGISNAANVTHSLDAYILRCVIRHCSYDPEHIKKKLIRVNYELSQRSGDTGELIYPDITRTDYADMTNEELVGMYINLEDVLSYKPFSVLTVHDCYAVHSNHVNRLRYWYNQIMARLSVSGILDDICSQIMGKDVFIPFDYEDVFNDIKENDYAIC